MTPFSPKNAPGSRTVTTSPIFIFSLSSLPGFPDEIIITSLVLEVTRLLRGTPLQAGLSVVDDLDQRVRQRLADPIHEIVDRRAAIGWRRDEECYFATVDLDADRDPAVCLAAFVLANLHSRNRGLVDVNIG